MDVLIISPDLSPYLGQTDRAASVAALSKTLRGFEHRVTVIAPVLAGMDPGARGLARRLTSVEVDVGGDKLSLELYDGRSAGGVELLFLGHRELLSSAERVDELEDERDAKRAALFARGAIALASQMDRSWELIHAHDWVGGLALAHAQKSPALGALPTVLTLHHPDQRAPLSLAQAALLGLSPEELPAPFALAAGLRAAHRVVVGSAALASSLRAEEEPLHASYAALGERLASIAPGVDAAIWNAATDPKLAYRFDPMDLHGKARNKAHLQREFDLPERDDVPLFAALGSRAAGGGLELLGELAPALLRNDCQVTVVLDCADDDPLHTRFEELSERWPDRLQVHLDPDSTLFHQALAGADFITLPCQDEPCGSLAMIAQRYGALPVLTALPSALDAIVDCDVSLATGTGFLCAPGSLDELLAVHRRAIAAFGRAKAFRQLQQKVMRLDRSWERSVRLYEQLYRAAMGRE